MKSEESPWRHQDIALITFGVMDVIETQFDIAFASELALKEKQIQQNYRPVIAVHKWFARRPGTLFRCLLLSEYLSAPLRDTFYSAHDLTGLKIADPFMGGGTPLLEANRIGCDVQGFDINPMSYWIVQEELESIDLTAYRQALTAFQHALAQKVGLFYQTNCQHCDKPAPVKYFLWVKTARCLSCGTEVSLFPGYLLSQDKRHPMNVLVCWKCGHLAEVTGLETPGKCAQCASSLRVDGPAKRGKCPCSNCGNPIAYPISDGGAPEHRLFAIEYYCPRCKSTHSGRFFKSPDDADHACVEKANIEWRSMRARFAPHDSIPEGDESSRLHRWGYRWYDELFNARQLLGLELSCRLIEKQPNRRLRHALATNLSDLLRYQNMLCRYDVMALKSLDIFSVHGFPVGLVECESNLLGIANGNGVSVGSGGWSNISEKYFKAKQYCDAPFEVLHNKGKKTIVPIHGEWIGEHRHNDFMGTSSQEKRDIELKCMSSTDVGLKPKSLDGVFTDPPYFGNVQYAELMDFCYVWLRRLVDDPAFQKSSTRDPSELTGNTTESRGIEHFAEGMSSVFSHMAKALKKDRPLVFTFHHNKLEAYMPIVVALLDSRLVCTASIPCPAEMAASIHIHGTNSSIVDSVFVARATDTTPKKWLASTPSEVARLVSDDLAELKKGGVAPTSGDVRCVIYGHLARLAAWHLHKGWKRNRPTSSRLSAVSGWIEQFGGVAAVESELVGRRKKHEVSI